MRNSVANIIIYPEYPGLSCPVETDCVPPADILGNYTGGIHILEGHVEAALVVPRGIGDFILGLDAVVEKAFFGIGIGGIVNGVLLDGIASVRSIYADGRPDGNPLTVEPRA